MKKPAIPSNEAERLVALYRLTVLDTPPENRFDRITRLALRLFEVPIALISLIDDHRQWFKSSQGLAGPEAPRATSFCTHTILQSDPLVISDAQTDPRFNDHPLVSGEPFIRFYAGVPLQTLDGYQVGTFCIIDHQPHTLTPEDLLALQDLAGWANNELNAHEFSRIMQEQAHNEKALKPSEEKYQMLAEGTMDMVTLNDLEGHILCINEAATLITGRTVEEITDLSGFSQMHPDDPERVCKQAYRPNLQSQSSQELFAKVFQLNPLPMAISHLSDGTYLNVNDTLIEQTGYSREELIGHSASEMMWTGSYTRESFVKPLYEHGTFSNMEVIYRIKSGELRTSLCSAALFDLNNEKYILSIFVDITERKQADARLKFLASVLTQVSDAEVAIDNNNYQVTYWNQGVERLFGFLAAEVLGRPLIEFYQTRWLAPQDEEKALPALSQTGSWQGEVTLLKHNGESIYVETTTSILKDENNCDIGLLAVIRNITERKQAEEALSRSQALFLQSQKMESIGRLAGGVAHDFNNLLTGILGYADLALLSLNEGDPLREDLIEKR